MGLGVSETDACVCRDTARQLLRFVFSIVDQRNLANFRRFVCLGNLGDVSEAVKYGKTKDDFADKLSTRFPCLPRMRDRFGARSSRQLRPFLPFFNVKVREQSSRLS